MERGTNPGGEVCAAGDSPLEGSLNSGSGAQWHRGPGGVALAGLQRGVLFLVLLMVPVGPQACRVQGRFPDLSAWTQSTEVVGLRPPTPPEPQAAAALGPAGGVTPMGSVLAPTGLPNPWRQATTPAEQTRCGRTSPLPGMAVWLLSAHYPQRQPDGGAGRAALLVNCPSTTGRFWRNPGSSPSEGLVIPVARVPSAFPQNHASSRKSPTEPLGEPGKRRGSSEVLRRQGGLTRRGPQQGSGLTLLLHSSSWPT